MCILIGTLREAHPIGCSNFSLLLKRKLLRLNWRCCQGVGLIDLGGGHYIHFLMRNIILVPYLSGPPISQDA